MAPCLPLLSCRDAASQESPVRPPRPPRYQITRQPSLSSVKTTASATVVGSRCSSDKRHCVAAAAPSLGQSFRQDCRVIGRDNSAQSLTSLIRRANDFLSRSTTLVSSLRASSPPPHVAESRPQSHLPTLAAANTTAGTVSSSSAATTPCPSSPTSSLRHKRDFSDLRAQFRRIATPGTDGGKRMSRVVSEDGESCWVTDDEEWDADEEDGFWMK